MRISDWSSDVCSSDLLLHFTRIGRSTDQDQLFGKIDGDHGFTAAAVALGIGPEAGEIDDGEFRHEIGKLARLWADQQRENEQNMPCQFDDDTQVDAVFRLRSEEHTSELQSLMRMSYAVVCLKKKQY